MKVTGQQGRNINDKYSHTQNRSDCRGPLHTSAMRNLDSRYQSDHFADNANTSAESADGSTGNIPGNMLFSSRATYDFGPKLQDLNVALG